MTMHPQSQPMFQCVSFPNCSVPVPSAQVFHNSTTDSHVMWRPFTSLDKAYLRLSPEGSVMSSRLRQDKVQFWNKLIPELRRSLSGIQDKEEVRSMAVGRIFQPLTVELWVFLFVAVGLLATVCVLGVFLWRTMKLKRGLEKKLITSRQTDSVHFNTSVYNSHQCAEI